MLGSLLASTVAILHATLRPRRAWEASDKSKTRWLIVNAAGLVFCFVGAGLFITPIYFLRIRPKAAVARRREGPGGGPSISNLGRDECEDRATLRASPPSTGRQPKSAKPRRRQRLGEGGIVALILGTVACVILIGVYVAQLNWIQRTGTVLSQVCHDTSEAGTKCTVVVSWRAANGQTKTITRHDVSIQSITVDNGAPTMTLHFQNQHSENPSDPIGALAFVLVALVVLAATPCVFISARRVSAHAKPPPPWAPPS